MNHRSVNPVRKLDPSDSSDSFSSSSRLRQAWQKKRGFLSNGVNKPRTPASCFRKKTAGVRDKAPKSKVLKAALDLFSSKGYSETKMTEIARSIGISVGALYLRFKSKEELCLELIKDQTKDFFERTKNLQDKDPLKILKDYIALNLDYAFQKRQLLSLFIREHKLPFIQPLRRNFFKTQHKIIEDILSAGIKRGIFRPMDTKDTASMIFASIRGAVLLKLIFGIGDVKEMSNSLFKLITNGIRRHPNKGCLISQIKRQDYTDRLSV